MLDTAKLHSTDFCYALDDVGRFLAKEVLDFIKFSFGIFQRVMKKPGRNTDDIHFHFGENVGDLEWMGQIRFTGESNLSLVDLG